MSNGGDLVWLRILGCIQLGAAAAVGEALDLAPVDYVNQAIVHLLRQGASVGRSFHLINLRPLPWTNVLDVVIPFQ